MSRGVGSTSSELASFEGGPSVDESGALAGSAATGAESLPGADGSVDVGWAAEAGAGSVAATFAAGVAGAG
jgi:hypothetical protein